MARFQIIREYTRYCPHTDAIIGSAVERFPMAYQTKEYAVARAVQMYEADGWEDSYRVIEWGGDVWRCAPIMTPSYGSSEIPF